MQWQEKFKQLKITDLIAVEGKGGKVSFLSPECVPTQKKLEHLAV